MYKAQESLSLLKRKLNSNPDSGNSRRHPSRGVPERENLLRNQVSPSLPGERRTIGASKPQQSASSFPSQPQYSFGEGAPRHRERAEPQAGRGYARQESGPPAVGKATPSVPVPPPPASAGGYAPASIARREAARYDKDPDERLPGSLNPEGSGWKAPPEVEGEKVPCSMGCGRSFNHQALVVHERICVKVFQKKRREFDVVKQRLTNLEGIGNLPKPKPEAFAPRPKAKVPKWKIESHNLRVGLRQARGLAPPAFGTSKDVAGAQQADMETRIKCAHCTRMFDPKVAERHIPFCANKEKMSKMKNGPKPPPQGKKR